MKFSKITFLMVLPFFVFADNPIVPADSDSSQSELILVSGSGRDSFS